jgi:hypothetical protein
MLTPLQVGLVEDDALMMAGENGQEAGDEAVTVESVTFGDNEHVRNSDTPKQMIDQKIDRIPPHETTSISYTLVVPMGKTGKAVFLGIDQQSADNGRAEFVGTPGARIALKSQTDAIRGTKQTEPGHARQLLLNARDGESHTIGTTFKFSVAAIPVNYSVNYFKEGLFVNEVGQKVAALIVNQTVNSDSGKPADDLDKVFVSEIVQYEKLTGTLANAKTFNTGYRKTPASQKALPDNHTVAVEFIKADGAVAIANQAFKFKDNRTGAQDVQITNSGYTITKLIEDYDGTWKVKVTKIGNKVTVKVKDKVGDPEAVSEYKSEAGATDPKEGISTKPIAGS